MQVKFNVGRWPSQVASSRNHPFGPLDLAGRLFKLLAPAVGLGVIASALAKLLWRWPLRPVRWRRLAAWASGASAAAPLAGLVVTSHGGRKASCLAMVLACALALWWAGWRRASR